LRVDAPLDEGVAGPTPGRDQKVLVLGDDALAWERRQHSAAHLSSKLNDRDF
jgi:hypothetical protein